MDKKVIQQAAEFMLKAHEGENRKGGAPYFVHPCAVLAQVVDWGVLDTTIGAACLLHDVRENNLSISHENLVDTFGDKIANLVDELTFMPTVHLDPQVKAKLKAEYMASFGSKSIESLLVKLADRCCNVCDFFATDPNYAPKYFSKASSLYEAMVQRQPEFLERFGEAVFPRLRNSHSTLMQMVA